MKKAPIIIEVCGIPYSKKTTSISKLSKYLKEKKYKYKIIEEFTGKRQTKDIDFYEKSKHSPDLNIIRATKCLKEIMLSVYLEDIDLIIIDRGFFDTYCWISWFKKKNSDYEALINLSKELINTAQYYSSKYQVVWLDIEPIESIALHASQGKIVNLTTATTLRKEYEKAYSELQSIIKVLPINTSKINSDVVAKKILYSLKINVF